MKHIFIASSVADLLISLPCEYMEPWPRNRKFIIYENGQIWSCFRNRFLGVYENGPQGYWRVSMCGKSYSVHRVVAETFIPNDDPERKIFVDHKDSDPSNNHRSNLQWITPSDNAKKAKRGVSRLCIPVQEVDESGNILQKFGSLTACAKALNMYRGTLKQNLDRRGRVPTKRETLVEFVQSPAKKRKASLPRDAKKIPGYQVACTPDGTIYSLRSNLPLRPFRTGYYFQIGVRDDSGVFSKRSVHRLVALTFHGSAPTEKHVVDHWNANSVDNHAVNLEYVTPSENTQRWRDTLVKKKVQLISREGKVVASYNSVREAAEAHNITTENVYLSIRHRGSGPFTWRETPSIPTQVDCAKEFYSQGHTVILRNAETQEEVHRFRSMKQGAGILGIPYNIMCRRCNENSMVDGITYRVGE